MSIARTTATRLLVVYFAAVWLAVALRIDRFPLTWAPMYSTYEPSTLIRINMVDEAEMRGGLYVTHANGSKSRLSARDLNLPKWNFWRLYYQRVRERGPIKHKQGNTNLSTFNRAWRGLEAGEPNFSADWPCRLFWSVNRTLGLEPGDPGFIVRIEAKYTSRFLDRADLGRSWEEPQLDVVEWDDTWRKLWTGGGRRCG